MNGSCRHLADAQVRKVALLTLHGKENVIGSVLKSAPECRVQGVDSYSACIDLFEHLFTRVYPRYSEGRHTHIEAARKKARTSMKPPVYRSEPQATAFLGPRTMKRRCCKTELNCRDTSLIPEKSALDTNPRR